MGLGDPGRRAEPGRDTRRSGGRETLEETGWQPGPLRPLVHFNPVNGFSDQVFHIFVADGATHVGEPTDAGESERIEWVPLNEVRRIVRDNEMLDGLSFTAMAYALAFGAFDRRSGLKTANVTALGSGLERTVRVTTESEMKARACSSCRVTLSKWTRSAVRSRRAVRQLAGPAMAAAALPHRCARDRTGVRAHRRDEWRRRQLSQRDQPRRRAFSVDKWVVPADVSGPFTSTSVFPQDEANKIRARPGVEAAEPVAFFRATAKTTASKT